MSGLYESITGRTKLVQLTPLSKWLNEQPEQVIAIHKGVKATTADFLSLVHEWKTTIEARDGVRWAVYHNDPFEFLAILFALWQLKKIACIPGDNCEGTIHNLRGHVAGFIGEFPIETQAINVKNSEGVRPSLNIRSWLNLESEFIALEIYTSGSSGKPTAITKTIGQLDKEIQTINSLWPSREKSVVLSTVTHQHFYGMTFGLFIPFCTGQAFERQRCNYSEDILYYAKYYVSFLLVSSPSHLGRMNTGLNWSELSERCQYILSSAAPLLREDSLKVSQLLNASVREIYGSSETGAIAWRSQKEGESEAKWKTMPNVEAEVSSEGTLSLKSNYLASNESIILPDKVLFDLQGLFILQGREDSVVKIEGKRVSFTAIEQLLITHGLVKQVKAIVLERYRVEVGVVIQLTEEGSDILNTLGRKHLVTIFKSILLPHFEVVILPRRWRFVTQFPFNSQGKLPVSNLLALFDKKIGGGEQVKWPRIIDEVLVDGQCKIAIRIPEDLIYFDGHFTGEPILPGIVQVNWAEVFGRRIFSIVGTFEALEVIKFQQLVFPNNKITITLNYQKDNKKLSFIYESDKGVHSSGRICFD